jgi:hypothetical protein
MTMNDPIDERLRSVCRRLARHEPGRSLWPGVCAAISPRRAPRRWPIFVTAAAGALATLLALVYVRTKPPRPSLESGAYYEDAAPGPGDAYGESGRRGLPEFPTKDA